MLSLFHERERLFQAIRDGHGLAPHVGRLALVSALSALAYGLVLGAQIGGWQVASSPVKLPLVMLGTSVICIGVLYVMLALAGTRARLAQAFGLALCSVTASSVAMVALLPVAAFWTFCAGQRHDVIVLVHSATFAVAGSLGGRFGLQAAQEAFGRIRVRRVMLAYMLVYGLVAQQMAWIFRPHFTATTVFMRPISTGGSALESVYQIGKRLVRGQANPIDPP